MKKSLWIIIVVIVVVLGAGAAWWVIRDRNNNSNNTGNATFTAVDACAVFTLEDAQQVLGASAQQGTYVPEASTSGDLAITGCNYTNAAANPADIKVATVLVRSPLTETGLQDNQLYFAEQRPVGVEDVSGYGEAAFWDPATGQLNILKNGNWAVVQIGSINPADSNLAQTQQLANVIIAEL